MQDLTLDLTQLHRNRRASIKKGDLDTARQLIKVMKSRRVAVGLNTELALIEGMIEGGTPWPTVEKELVSFVAADDRRRRLGDMHMATVVLALVRMGDLEAARRALKVLPVKYVQNSGP